MNIVFTKNAWEDFEYWLENDIKKAIKIKDLIKSIKQDPFRGTGNPEGLKHGRFKGFWSRKINSEHRLVYRVIGKSGQDKKCEIIMCRFHYDDK